MAGQEWYSDMDRRKVLLGSAGAFTTLVAGCAGSTGSENSAGNGADDDHPGNGDSAGNGSDQRDDQGETPDETDEERGNGGDGGRPADVPGFVPDACELDSGLIRIKEFERRGRTLTVCVVAMTDDHTKLRSELDELPAGLERGIENAEGFFGEIEEIEFTLENEARETLLSISLNADRLREFLDGKLTDEELVEMARHEIEQA